MQTELKDNRNLEENSQSPVPPTPHFDSKRIAAAKPVEFLPDDFGHRRNRSLPHILIGALVGLALVATIGLGLVLLNRAQLQPADDASASIDHPSTETPVPATAPASVRKKETSAREDAPRSHARRKPESLAPVLRITEPPVEGKPKARLVTVIH